jgi:DNA end-binding protein Ku
VSDRDRERLPLPSTDTIEVLAVAADHDIDAPLYLDQAYYLEPEPSGSRPYALLRQAREQAGRSAIGKMALRQREQLCQVSAHDKLLVLDTLHRRDEIRPPQMLKIPRGPVEVGKRELTMATTLLDNLTTTLDPHRYRDDYREALLKVAEAKGERRSFPEARPQARGDTVADLMSALKAAVEQTRADRQRGKGHPEPKAAPARRAGPRKRRAGPTPDRAS